MDCQACAPCHPECRTCRQAGPYECNGDCVHYVEDGRCVSKCSPSHYATDDGRCMPCDISCSNCTGPTPADCTSCRHYTLYDDFLNRHSPGADVSIISVFGDISNQNQIKLRSFFYNKVPSSPADCRRPGTDWQISVCWTFTEPGLLAEIERLTLPSNESRTVCLS